jgi:hypothetical protein
MPVFPIVRFVDKMSAAPVIGLDLNDDDPIRTSNNDFTIGAPSFDGDPLSVGVKLGYRTLTLRCRVYDSNAVALVAYSALAKQIIAPSNVLMVQLDSKQPPVFFRTYRTQPGEIDFTNVKAIGAGGQSYYQLSVTLTADHAAYGLPETNTVTISNDPASGTNKCFYRWPVPVLGDLETPLYLEAATSDVRGQNRLLASQALIGGASQTGPVLVQANALTHGGAVAGGAAPVGTLVDNTGDAAMSGGNYTRYTGSASDDGSVAPVSLLYGLNLLPGTLVGDYRVFMRVRCGAAVDVWSFSIAQIGAVTPNYALFDGDTVAYLRGTTGPHWLDMQTIFRFPYGAPPVDPIGAFDTAYTNPGLSFAVLMHSDAVAAKTVDFDCLLFVPVGLDQAVATRYATTAYDASLPGTSYKAVWNGPNDTRYLLDGSNNYSPGIAPKADGGLPTLVPGADNSIHYLQHIGTGYNDPRTSSTSGVNDSLSASTVLTWKYWPRYLWLRPTGG